MTPQTLREGIFNLKTRRFGTVAEIMIQILKEFDDPKNIFHDLYDHTTNEKIEVKFSTVRSKHNEKITKNNILSCIEAELFQNRAVKSNEAGSKQFDCNIQQVKKSEFDTLYYGLFFYDKIIIFKIKSEEINENVNYSNKQHKGNEGEGQFHINQNNLHMHMENYKFQELTYSELLELLESACST